MLCILDLVLLSTHIKVKANKYFMNMNIFCNTYTYIMLNIIKPFLMINLNITNNDKTPQCLTNILVFL